MHKNNFKTDQIRVTPERVPGGLRLQRRAGTPQAAGPVSNKKCFEIVFKFLIFFFLTFFVQPLFADHYDDAMSLLKQGRHEEAAIYFAAFAYESPRHKNAPEALASAGRLLDKFQDSLSEAAEKKCYWSKGAPKTPACMQEHVTQFNKRFGHQAFEYTGGTGIAFIQYTGAHYERILARYAKSKYAAEAEFYLLLRRLKGHPDEVLPRVEGYLRRFPSGEWNRRATLLRGRVNEDISYIWRKWTWVVYNGKITEDELIIKSQPYRMAAIKAFHEVIEKGKNTPEGVIAKRDLELLLQEGDDGNIYSITNDSSGGTWSAWGLTFP
ncbi:MAG: hypothetical protein A3I05_08435 [Deltaproteobacteria bacterium RIFCSPLOWO2_02_FULL_44_10]|nr:MAG: hypothetical protein A3C46_05480 [Deltaproteobacteria bacterium RIFCSPHIGHO2_02_FULL_44_16]OGQ45511.1 MAG: hypothetical protein A3I05_08435 [Deltaproteobacteria bacterium RIFCSPLOWO2_02_FULL_44_10]